MYVKIIMGVVQMDKFASIAIEIHLASVNKEEYNETELKKTLKKRLNMVHIFSILMASAAVFFSIYCTVEYSLAC